MARSIEQTQRILTEIWKGVFEDEDIDAESSFYDLGGNSILATEMAQAIESELGIVIPVETIYDCDTLGELSEACFDTQESDTWDVSDAQLRASQ